MKPGDPIRFYTNDLFNLKKDRPCEICKKPMIEHLWADLNEDGVVIACSEEK